METLPRYIIKMDKVMKILDDFYYDLRAPGPGHGPDQCLNRAFNKFQNIWDELKKEAKDKAREELIRQLNENTIF